jgi:hypothetical protein
MGNLFTGSYTVRRLLLCMGFGAVVITVATIRNAIGAGEAGAIPEAIGILAVAAAGGAGAGAVHFFTGRLVPLGRGYAYLYGVLMVETYLFAIMTGLVISAELDPAADPKNVKLFDHWPGFAVLGVVCGVVWGHLMRDEYLKQGRVMD